MFLQDFIIEKLQKYTIQINCDIIYLQVFIKFLYLRYKNVLLQCGYKYITYIKIYVMLLILF